MLSKYLQQSEQSCASGRSLCPLVWMTHVLYSMCAGSRTIHILILYHMKTVLEVN